MFATQGVVSSMLSISNCMSQQHLQEEQRPWWDIPCEEFDYSQLLQLDASSSVHAKPVNPYMTASRQIDNKLFVGGLQPHTTSESMQAYFLQYGHCECVVMMDKTTGRSRGFGFVTFQTPEQVQAVLQNTGKWGGAQHIIDGKPVECKACEAKGSAPPPVLQQKQHQQAIVSSDQSVASYSDLVSQNVLANRVFVGGLAQTCDDAKLQAFFQQFGPTTDVKVMLDKDTGRSRGFGYVSFVSPQSVELALANSMQNVIDDKWVEVKRCEAKGIRTSSNVDVETTPQSQQEIADQANQLALLLQDPRLGLQGFLGPMLQQLQEAANVAKAGKGGRYRPY